jgi:P4 family phage/plasmid primase-like protien
MDEFSFTEYLNMEQVEKWLNIDYHEWYEKFNVANTKKNRGDPTNRPKTYWKTTRKELTKIYKGKCPVRTIEYKYAKGQTRGRMYGNMWCIQRLSEVDRNFLCQGQGLYDLDMVASHPSIALYLCKKHNFNTPYLYKYVNERDEIHKTRNITKQQILISINSDKLDKGDDFLINLNKELDHVTCALPILYDNLVDGEILNKKNPKSSKFNKILCVFENQILHSVIKLIRPEQVCSLWYDGMFIKYKHDINEINKHTEEYGVKWKYKPIKSNIKLDIDTKNQYRKCIDFFHTLDDASQNRIAEMYMEELNSRGILQNYKCFRTIDKKKVEYEWYRYNKYNIIENHGNQPPNALMKDIIFLRDKIRKNKNVAQELLEMKSEKYKQIESCARKWEDRLGNNNFKKQMMLEFRELFCQEDNKWLDDIDTNINILPFKNGKCFDFKLKKFRNIEREDFVMTFIGYNAPEQPDNPEVLNEVQKFLDNLFESEKVLKFILDTLYFSLYTNKFEKFYIWTGIGRNGKGVLLNLLSKSMGKFLYSPSGQFLTTAIRSDSADSSLYNCNGKRIVMVSEPENEDNTKEIKFNVPKIKKLTGRDIIETRKLYSLPIEFVPSFTLFMMCNTIPFTEDCDSAMMDRMLCVLFPFRFCNLPQAEENEKQIDTSLKTKFQQELYYRAFMYILLNHGKNIEKDDLVIPPEVVKETNKYFSDCDVVKDFLDANYTIFKDKNKNKFFVKAEDLYRDYLSNNSGKKIGKKAFLNFMKTQGHVYTRNQSFKELNGNIKVKSIGRGYFGLIKTENLGKIQACNYII